MVELTNNNYVIDKATLSGTLLKVDWDDNLINCIIYERGNLINEFINSEDKGCKNARVADCTYMFTDSWNSWHVNSNNELVIVVHNTWSAICNGSGAGGYTGPGELAEQADPAAMVIIGADQITMIDCFTVVPETLRIQRNCRYTTIM